jgi:hypothetical protein
MKANYPYPKNEIEFYSRQYAISQLVENYDFNHLMAYYIYGLNTLKNINHIIDNGLFELVNRTEFQVEQDKVYFVVRTETIKRAMQKLTTTSIIICKDSVMINYNN